MITVKLDFTELDRAASDTLGRTVDEFADYCAAMFQDERFRWPGVTKRQSGEIAGTVRDVFDTGTLANSQQVERVSPTAFSVEWNAPYAAAVFLGAVFKSRPGSLPARNVPEIAANELDLAETFARHLKARL